MSQRGRPGSAQSSSNQPRLAMDGAEALLWGKKTHDDQVYLNKRMKELEEQHRDYDARIQATEAIAEAAEAATSRIRRIEQQVTAIESDEQDRPFDKWAEGEISSFKSFMEKNKNVRQKQIELEEKISRLEDSVDKAKDSSNDLSALLSRIARLEKDHISDANRIKSLEADVTSLTLLRQDWAPSSGVARGSSVRPTPRQMMPPPPRQPPRAVQPETHDDEETEDEDLASAFLKDHQPAQRQIQTPHSPVRQPRSPSAAPLSSPSKVPAMNARLRMMQRKSINEPKRSRDGDEGHSNFDSPPATQIVERQSPRTSRHDEDYPRPSVRQRSPTKSGGMAPSSASQAVVQQKAPAETQIVKKAAKGKARVEAPLVRDMSAARGRESSPAKQREASPAKQRAASPEKQRAASLDKRRQPSLEKRREPSPEKRRESSPKKRRQPSPEKRREPSPEKRREPSPEKLREPSPAKRREPSRAKSREPSPEKRREPSPDKRDAPSPTKRAKVSPVKYSKAVPAKAAPDANPATQAAAKGPSRKRKLDEDEFSSRVTRSQIRESQGIIPTVEDHTSKEPAAKRKKVPDTRSKASDVTGSPNKVASRAADVGQPSSRKAAPKVTKAAKRTPQQTCEPCRRKHMGCDHARPGCGQCTRSRKPVICVYADSVNEPRQTATKALSSPKKKASASETKGILRNPASRIRAHDDEAVPLSKTSNAGNRSSSPTKASSSRNGPKAAPSARKAPRSAMATLSSSPVVSSNPRRSKPSANVMPAFEDVFGVQDSD